jgi:hypothetical protein
MYATIMEDVFPTGKLHFVKNINNLQQPGFYYATVKSDLPFPILPHRRVQESPKLGYNNITESYDIVFSNGRFTELYTSYELNFFIQNGGKLENLE